MTPEEKELQIRDLCGRLPVGVKARSNASHLKINTIDGYYVFDDGKRVFHLLEPDFWQTIDEFQYYLRSLSNMTEEEKEEYDDLRQKYYKNVKSAATDLIDWLNKHHFDYRGLIEKGLALEAPEGMYE